MANRLNVANIGYDDNNDALTIASDGTISAGKLGSGVVFPAGHVIQVVYAEHSTQTSTSSTEFVDTSLSASITPISTSNKILISFSLPLEVSSSGVSQAFATVFAGNSLTGTDLAPSASNGFGHIYTSDLGIISIVNGFYLHSPNTISSQLYTVAYRTTSGTAWTFSSDTAGALVLMEVVG